MPIYEKDRLKFMDITVEQLGDKHQLSPANNGMQRIDDCMSYSITSKLFVANIHSIFVCSELQMYKVVLKRGASIINVTLSEATQVMNSRGSYVSIREGSLRPTSTLLIVKDDGESEEYSVISVTPSSIAPTYRIRTSRSNYVTAAGLVVQTD